MNTVNKVATVIASCPIKIDGDIKKKLVETGDAEEMLRDMSYEEARIDILIDGLKESLSNLNCFNVEFIPHIKEESLTVDSFSILEKGIRKDYKVDIEGTIFCVASERILTICSC